jgi:hypothetical protein
MTWRSGRALRLASAGVVVFHVVAFGLWAPGRDAHIYFAANLDDLYKGNVFTDTYNYSPAFAWWIQPLQALPFDAFRTMIAAINMAGLVFLIGPVFTAVVLLAQVQPVWTEFQQGNLNFLVAALLLLGFQQSAWYAFPLLTKATPGIGLVWFAVRREWRALALALGATFAIALPSLVLVPEAWVQFVGSLSRNTQVDAQVGAPLLLRALLATAVIAWGAHTDRPWSVLVGVALVAHSNGGGWLVVLGIVRLLRRGWAPTTNTRADMNQRPLASA